MKILSKITTILSFFLVVSCGNTKSEKQVKPNKPNIVIIYTDGGNSNYPTAVVGTVNASNNSISFGSATVIETTGADTNRIGVGFDSSNNKIVVAYRDT